MTDSPETQPPAFEVTLTQSVMADLESTAERINTFQREIAHLSAAIESRRADLEGEVVIHVANNYETLLADPDLKPNQAVRSTAMMLSYVGIRKAILTELTQKYNEQRVAEVDAQLQGATIRARSLTGRGFAHDNGRGILRGPADPVEVTATFERYAPDHHTIYLRDGGNTYHIRLFRLNVDETLFPAATIEVLSV